ncbi:MAG TPA: hypothetical protein VFH08_10245 [Chitinophagaceae bacterium]|nr:hypothetical protein [Chitinophagaceae bacterium]
MRPFINICCFILFAAPTFAQPYVDPFQVRYTYGFRNDKAEATPFTHLWVGSDIPIKIKDNTYLLVSPFYERWEIDSASKDEIVPPVQSIAFPVGLMLPLNDSKWALTILPTLRTNSEELFSDKTFQFGGATFITWARKAQQKFRFGVYVNDEFFGVFVMPLIGADWRIDEKNYLFGLLPGRLTWEHQWSKNLFGGATFRAITNSYRLSGGQYLRIDDNQVSIYMDYYPAKRFCITLEPGYGVFRKMRTGINDKHYLTNRNWGDGPFIKLSTAYRIRL